MGVGGGGGRMVTEEALQDHAGCLEVQLITPIIWLVLKGMYRALIPSFPSKNQGVYDCTP